jgi:hypothetical protein
VLARHEELVELAFAPDIPKNFCKPMMEARADLLLVARRQHRAGEKSQSQKAEQTDTPGAEGRWAGNNSSRTSKVSNSTDHNKHCTMANPNPTRFQNSNRRDRDIRHDANHRRRGDHVRHRLTRRSRRLPELGLR